MKFLNLSYLLGAFCILIFSTCKNKLNINAPYKEVPTIYAVLNPQETIQMIRINKVFLGESNANDMAKVADSINYAAGALQVTLEHSDYGIPSIATPTGNKLVITFHDSIIQTNPGAFNTTQRVYVSYDKLLTHGEYTLKVKHSDGSGKVFTAKATSLDSVNAGISPILTYAPFCSPYYPVPPGSVSPLDPIATAAAYIDYSNQNINYSPKFFPNTGAIYSMTLRFHFHDYVGGDSIARFIDYNFNNETIRDLRTIGNSKVFGFDFKGSDLFNALGNALSKLELDNTITRKMYKLQAMAYSSTQDYADYLQFSAPSLSIAQEKPIYSNFDNRDAMGIFTFRTRHSIFKNMSTALISEFSSNKYTCGYHFLNAANAYAGCQ